MKKNPFKKNREGSTIRVRWALLTMGVIFLTFSLLSYILLTTYQKVMINNEEEGIEDLAEELVDRFSHHYYPLTEESTETMLQEPEIELGPIPAPKNEVPRSEEFSTPISLTKGGIIVKVFDIDEELIYQTDRIEFDFAPTEERKITEINGPAGTALSLIEPVYSVYHHDLIGYVQVVQTLEAYHEMMEDILYFTIFIEIIAFVVSLIIGWLLVSTFVRPITDLTAAMESIQQNLESDVRLDEGSKDNEFSRLARTYNEMVDIMQKNITSQKQFVEDVSHELRTPVSIVEGHLKMLDRWGKEDSQILEESIHASLTETKRMKSLVQEMLDLSRIREIDVYYKNEMTNVGELANQLVTNFKMLYPDFVINVDIDFDNEVFVNMYRNHLEQIMVNILDNAVKYSTDRKEVHVSVSKGKEDVDIIIQDFGPGIAEEDLDKIFNRFYRVDKARSREKGGTGLGLPIVKELVEGYGGKINVTSTLGQGSIFQVTIPIYKEEN